MKKILCILLILSTISLMILSCSDTGSGTETTTRKDDTNGVDGEETTIELKSALSTIESVNYDGYEFKIITQNMDNRQVDFIAEEQTGATLNDLVYSRNLAVEEKFNIKLTVTDNESGQIQSMITNNVSAGDNPYDLYMTNALIYTLARDGYLYPINEMPFIDLSRPWWDQNAKSGMSIGGNLYMATGDISPTGLMTSECALFNQKLFDAQNIEYPYQAAFDGNWTLDLMTEICTDLTIDLNGDGEIKVTDDLFSLTCWVDYAHALFYGAGGTFTNKDADDIPYLTWDMDSYVSIYDKIYNLVIGTNANYSTTDHEQSFKVFNEGRAYFCGITFQKVELFLRDMNDDYGVLPLPKFNESQPNYMTDVSGACSFLVIPASISDDTIDMIGAVTESMAAASYDIITPSLYEVIVSTKNVRDAESSDIVQLIIRNRIFDPAHMYYLSIDNYVEMLLKAKSTDVASYFATHETASQTALDEIVQKFIENNQ